jgi:hypothetical protein
LEKWLDGNKFRLGVFLGKESYTNVSLSIFEKWIQKDPLYDNVDGDYIDSIYNGALSHGPLENFNLVMDAFLKNSKDLPGDLLKYLSYSNDTTQQYRYLTLLFTSSMVKPQEKLSCITSMLESSYSSYKLIWTVFKTSWKKLEAIQSPKLAELIENVVSRFRSTELIQEAKNRVGKDKWNVPIKGEKMIYRGIRRGIERALASKKFNIF